MINNFHRWLTPGVACAWDLDWPNKLKRELCLSPTVWNSKETFVWETVSLMKGNVNREKWSARGKTNWSSNNRMHGSNDWFLCYSIDIRQLEWSGTSWEAKKGGWVIVDNPALSAVRPSLVASSYPQQRAAFARNEGCTAESAATSTYSMREEVVLLT